MGGRRKRTLTVADAKHHPDSAARCWFCGEVRNVPVKKYGGMCMSCWLDFHEDDIALELWGVEVMA
jgi:hypothetical protein